MDVADGELAANIVNEQHCHKQSAISPVTSPVIEVFCDNGPLIGNQIRFVLLTNGAQLVLCDVHAYGGNDYIYSRPKVTLHFSFLNISILVLILSRWNIAISFQHFSTHNS